MRRIFLAIVAIVALSAAQPASSQDLKSILGSLANKTSGSSSSSAASGLGSILNTVGSLIGGNVDYSTLVGSWTYAGPAVSFQSDNLLQKAGGAAASTMIENKIEPYYQRAGLTNLKMEFSSDSTFVATAGKFKAQGTVSTVSDGTFLFQFKAFGTVPSGKLTAYVEKSGSNVLLTFDASKLISLVSKIATISGNSTLQTASTLLNSYDGLNVGFELKKN